MYYGRAMDADQLTPAEFDAHVKAGTFRLAFVGMSNAGKSYRSRALRDELRDMDAISAWLGLPTSDGYAEREAEYLRLENLATRKAAMETGGKNLVFDTTGSVAHLEPSTLKLLKENCLVVHLDFGEESLEEVMDRFFKKPKPVAWAGYLTREAGESEEESIRRSYPKLLADRLAAYRRLAHVNIPAASVRDTSAQETLDLIKAKLR
jgi:shikimate kinase